MIFFVEAQTSAISNRHVSGHGLDARFGHGVHGSYMWAGERVMMKREPAPRKQA
ncbi:hypothetical protein [Lacticaseibacillus rhamnosus]|uniref:hypothetical protein n=1 Tax=Lacticaseibacillus rhamnosus TaxID=47715 RepID=UPI000B00163F|nr:hypothetical protein [Lacticaseibacillus rhamnosus]